MFAYVRKSGANIILFIEINEENFNFFTSLLS